MSRENKIGTLQFIVKSHTLWSTHKENDQGFTHQSFATFKVDDTVQILSSQIRTPIAVPHYPHLRFLVVWWSVYCVVGVIGQGESLPVLDHAYYCIIVAVGFPDPCTVRRDSPTQIYLVSVVTIIWYHLPGTKPRYG